MTRVRDTATCRGERQFNQTWPLVKLQWKRITLAALAGMFVGFGAAGAKSAFTVHQRADSPARSSLVRTAAAATPETQDLLRLRARNRRLEALVAVLQRRVQTQTTRQKQ